MSLKGCGQCLLRSKGAGRPTFLRGACKVKASCLDEETLGSELDASCGIDFPVPWKYLAAPREASDDGISPSLKKRLVSMGHIIFPPLYVPQCVYGSPLCYSSYLSMYLNTS